MSGVNKIILLGRLGQDPEIRTLQDGKIVTSFSLATSESYTNRNGEKVEQTEWHRIELWEKLAEVAQQWLKKGDMAYVEGKLKTEKWTDQNGQERSTLKIRGTALQLIGGSRQSNEGVDEQSGNYQPSEKQDKYATTAPPPLISAEDAKDDLPF